MSEKSDREDEEEDVRGEKEDRERRRERTEGEREERKDQTFNLVSSAPTDLRHR